MILKSSVNLHSLGLSIPVTFILILNLFSSEKGERVIVLLVMDLVELVIGYVLLVVSKIVVTS